MLRTHRKYRGVISRSFFWVVSIFYSVFFLGDVLLNSICLLNLTNCSSIKHVRTQPTLVWKSATHTHIHWLPGWPDVTTYTLHVQSLWGSSNQVCVPYCNLHPFLCQSCFCCSLFPFFSPSLCPCSFSSTFSICTGELKAPRTNSQCRLPQESMRTLKIVTNVCIKLWN